METEISKKEIQGPVNGLPSLDPLCSRRRVLKMGGISIIGISALAPHFAQAATKPLIVMDKAQGLVVADPLKCVGCGRCELACTEFNDGKAAPKISRIKIDRNLAFGPDGLLTYREGRGNWGDGLVVQDLCKQCPHPVPCANICPENAIIAAPAGKARMVDLEKCTGCKICLKACPWEMISFDPDTRKATKCHLCSGKPKCVEACPAEALSYVPWQDLTHETPPRNANPAGLPSERSAGCRECHLPGQKKNVSQGMGLLLGKTKGSSEFGSGWIDLIGTALIPLGLVLVGVHAIVRKVRNQ
jgi:Fe-S-cluster-containing dehydrogenase component